MKKKRVGSEVSRTKEPMDRTEEKMRTITVRCHLSNGNTESAERKVDPTGQRCLSSTQVFRSQDAGLP